MSASVETQLKKSQKALSAHQFAEARDGFRSVLQRFPGNIRAKRGFWISQSALADAGFAANHPPRQQLDEIAAALAAGRIEDAVTKALTLIARFPHGHGLHNLLGIAQATAGREQEAVAAFRAAVELKPNFLEARANLASRIMVQGDFESALPLVSESLEMAADDGASLNAMTVCLIGLQRFEDAATPARRAVEARPDDAEAHNNLGLCLRHLGKLDDAITSYRRALEIRPGFTDAILNLGIALTRAGQAEEAIKAYRSGIDDNKNNGKLHGNLGLALIETRQIDEAMAAFDRALDLDPDHLDASFNRFIATALGGQLDLAWPFAECRFDRRRNVPVDLRYQGDATAWDGQASLSGKTLLVHAEQGLGDTLMFIRYLTQLPAQEGVVRLAVQAPLHRLVSEQAGSLSQIEVVSLRDEEEGGHAPHDLHCPLMSLPFLLGDRAVPFAEPYLSVPSSDLVAWEGRLGTSEQPRVGFVFRGNPNHVNDRNRSIDLPRFMTALPEGPDYHFLGVDLQQGEQKLLSGRGDVRTHCEHLTDFCDTAALVSQMDRVVCVDTSIAHLAGTLGIETHVLLAYTPDWRWGLGTSGSVWYPSVTLHRQTTPGEWQPVLETLRTRLSVSAG